MAPWFDTHVHLDRYEPEKRAALLERAGTANVRVIAVGVDMESSRVICSLAGTAGRVVGVHPTHAAAGFEAELGRLAAEASVAGIGECGFDEAGDDWELQEQTFRTQCTLARGLHLPLVLHIDGAQAWAQLVTDSASMEDVTVIRHYFTGPEEQAHWHRERGHHLSFGKPLLRDEMLQAVAATYPPDLLLIETDSYPVTGRTTEPADVIRVGEALAGLRGWSIDETRERLAANTLAAFPRLH